MSAPTVHPGACEHFYNLALQYYVSARAALPCGINSVTGNLLHHAVEMLLKGQLSKTVPLGDLKDDKKFGHKLPLLWTAFKGLFPSEDLSVFDCVIQDLDRFDFIRYPDNILKRGAAIAIGMGRGRPMTVRSVLFPVPEYQIGVGDIDSIFDRLIPLCRLNPKAYFSFLTPRGRDALNEGNEESADWLPLSSG